MAWPFADPVRALMRDVLFWWGRGQLPGKVPITSWEQIGEYLSGPDVRHFREDVEAALPEARRALYFREALERAEKSRTVGGVWLDVAADIWQRAYGRMPTGDEVAWWLRHPDVELGLMYKVTVEGVEGFSAPITLNVSWTDTLADIEDKVTSYWLTGQRSPPRPGEVMEAVAEGARVNANLVGGALVARREPTIG